MTALCGGGASSARSGFGLTASIGIAQAAALLNNVPTQLAFAVAGLLGFLSWELATFCNTDPPPMPVPTATDYANVLGINGVAAQIAGVAVFRDLFGNLVWPTFCQCDTVTTPGPPALPTPPTNIPQVNPTQFPTAPSVSACWDMTASVTIPNDGATHPQNAWLPSASSVAFTDATFWGSGTVTAWAIPPGATQVTTVMDLVTAPTAAFGSDAYLFFYTSAHAYISNPHIANNSNHPFTANFAVPSNAAFWAIWTNDNVANSPAVLSGELKFFCSSQPQGSLNTSCCPPDPSLTALLQQLQSMVEAIYQAVGVPLHSYADGTAHTGLSGGGTVTLSEAAIAVRVNLTTDPASLGQAAGDPTFLYDRGFVVPIVNSAPIRNDVRLVYNPQMYLLPELTEQIGYYFHPGVVATVTELTAGP